MIQSISGILKDKSAGGAVVEVGGVGLCLFVSERDLAALPPLGENVSLHSHLHVREDAFELYGFTNKAGLDFFKLLIGVSGVGPKSALAVLSAAELNGLLAAIKEGRPDLLTKAPGIGRKTAERIILELRGKIKSPHSEELVGGMERDADLLDMLVGLGYKRDQARAAIEKSGGEAEGFEDRFRAALKILGKK